MRVRVLEGFYVLIGLYVIANVLLFILNISSLMSRSRQLSARGQETHVSVAFI